MGYITAKVIMSSFPNEGSALSISKDNTLKLWNLIEIHGFHFFI